MDKCSLGLDLPHRREVGLLIGTVPTDPRRARAIGSGTSDGTGVSLRSVSGTSTVPRPRWRLVGRRFEAQSFVGVRTPDVGLLPRLSYNDVLK